MFTGENEILRKVCLRVEYATIMRREIEGRSAARIRNEEIHRIKEKKTTLARCIKVRRNKTLGLMLRFKYGLKNNDDRTQGRIGSVLPARENR